MAISPAGNINILYHVPHRTRKFQASFFKPFSKNLLQKKNQYDIILISIKFSLSQGTVSAQFLSEESEGFFMNEKILQGKKNGMAVLLLIILA